MIDPFISDSVVALALASTGWRIRPLDLPRGRVWLKRVERLGWRMRLQKGNPRRGFEAERTALHVLGDAGLPVVPILAEGPDWLALPDAGPTLVQVLHDPCLTAAQRSAAFAAAGRALADLHLAGFAHGRPVLRDICWDGTVARFIDLERFRNRQAGALAQAVDVVVLVQGWFIAIPERRPELDVMLRAYEAGAGGATRVAARRLALGLRMLMPLVRLARRLFPKSRDWRAVPMTLDYLRA